MDLRSTPLHTRLVLLIWTVPWLSVSVHTGSWAQQVAATGGPSGSGIATSVPIGTPQPAGPAWLRPARNAAQKMKSALTPRPKAATDDPVSLSSPVRKVGPEIFTSAALMHERRGDTAQAIASYRQALEHAPKDRRALLGLARLLAASGKNQEAVTTYRQVTSQDPHDAVAWNDLGICYAQDGQWTQAVHALRSAVRESPKSLLYRNNLASVLVKAQRTEEALTELQAAHGRAAGHYNLAYLLQQNGDIATALQHTMRALQEDPNLRPAQLLHQSLQEQLDPGQGPEKRPVQVATRPVAPVAWVTSDDPPASEGAGLVYHEDVVGTAQRVELDGSPATQTVQRTPAILPTEEPLLLAGLPGVAIVAPLPDSYPATKHRQITLPVTASGTDTDPLQPVGYARLAYSTQGQRALPPSPEAILDSSQ